MKCRRVLCDRRSARMEEARIIHRILAGKSLEKRLESQEE
jgi:hypothetical protein